PLIVSLGPNTWSILTISSRKLKTLRLEKFSLLGLVMGSGSLGTGSLLKMSSRYCCATGLMEEICVPVVTQVPLALNATHTGCANVPARWAAVATWAEAVPL